MGNPLADPRLVHATALVDQAMRHAPSEVPRIIFDQYRASSQAVREAIVLALAGALLAARGRTASPMSRAEPAT